MTEDAAAIVSRLLSDALSADGGVDEIQVGGDDAESIAAEISRLAPRLPGGRRQLTSAVARAGRQLARRGEISSDRDAGIAWRALVLAAATLGHAGVYPLERLSFVTDQLLRKIAREAHERRPEGETGGRTTGAAGDVLAGLVVSRQLREAISRAVGTPVVPTYDALYEFDSGASEVGLHLDAEGYELTFHLLVEHSDGDLPSGSTLIAHDARATSAQHFVLRPGDAIVIGGRGTFHSWAPLGPGESRVLVAAGFRRGDDDARAKSVR